MQKSESSFTFVIDHLVKSSAPGQPQPVLVLPQFPADSRLCVVTTLEEYLRRTVPSLSSPRVWFMWTLDV